MRALLVGRFQPPHRGHLHAIAAAQRRWGRVLVAVGSAQSSHEPRNPFTAGERFEFLLAALADALGETGLRRVHLFPLPDVHRHAAWVSHVEGLVPAFDVVLTNNPLTRRLFTRAGHRVEGVALWKPDLCSGRHVRARWLAGETAAGLLPPAVQRGVDRVGGPARVRAMAQAEAEAHGRRPRA